MGIKIMDGLLFEINQDMRADRMGALWKNYGRWVIYAAVSIVIVTAAMVYWKHHQREGDHARRECGRKGARHKEIAHAAPSSASSLCNRFSEKRP